jgi:CheY-like chemotaxis protein
MPVSYVERVGAALLVSLNSELPGVRDPPIPRDSSPRRDGADGIEGLRFLYAEDHPEMQRAVARLLRVAGATVIVAQDGREATDKTLAGTFDVVLMDLRMPRMDGFDAARALRAAGCRLALIAVSADATPPVRVNALAAGFDVLLSKPFDVCDIVQAIHLVRDRQPVSNSSSDSDGASRDDGLS